MSDDELERHERHERDERHNEKDERDELAGLRALAIRVFIGLSALLIVGDVFGRLFRDPAFRADPVVSGLVFGTLLSLLGLEGVQRLLNKP